MSDSSSIDWVIIGSLIIGITVKKYKDISIYFCLMIVGLLLVIGYQQIESLLEIIEGTDPFLFVGSLMAGICCIVFALHGNNKSVEGKYKPLYPDKRLLLKRKLER